MVIPFFIGVAAFAVFMFLIVVFTLAVNDPGLVTFASAGILASVFAYVGVDFLDLPDPPAVVFAMVLFGFTSCLPFILDVGATNDG
jgi:hypothetical protein